MRLLALAFCYIGLGVHAVYATFQGESRWAFVLLALMYLVGEIGPIEKKEKV